MLLILQHSQASMTKPNIIDLNSVENNQGLCYFSFMVNLNRCNGSFNILDNPFHQICVPNKAENETLNVFNMLKIMHKSKALTKHASCKCK